jgi:hypothetical protein
MPVPDGSLTTARSHGYGTVASAMRLMRGDLED